MSRHEPVTLGQQEQEATRLLAQAGVDSPRLCARLLLGHALRLDRTACLLQWERPLTSREAASVMALAARRAAGEPLAHILGRREFYGRDFMVTPDTLIPRPETEGLVELALDMLAPGPLRFVDLGTGTGCIGISLACEREAWSGLLLDASLPALRVAASNAAALGVAQRLAVLQADMFTPPCASGAWDLVISNPPYISPAERGEVMAEVLACEPHAALFSPQEGLAHLAAAARAAMRMLRPGGLLLLEHGAGQSQSLAGILARLGFTDIFCRRDLAGHARCTGARQPRADAQ